MSRTKTIGIVAGALATAVAVGFVYQAIGAWRDRRRYPPPGRMAGPRGSRLHLYDLGAGKPAVILEAGIAASSVSWRPVQRAAAKFTRVVSYDRAGLGWSDAVHGPRPLLAIVADLRAALAEQGVPPPYVLVGHSFGGLVAHAFVAWKPDEVAGVVLIDPVLPADWIDAPHSKRRMLGYGVMLSRRGAWLARMGVVRLMLAMLVRGSRWLPQAVAAASSGPGAALIGRMIGQVQKLPPELWPVVQSQWRQAKSFLGMAAYLESLPDSAAVAAGLEYPKQIPLTIVSASDATPQQVREWDRMTDRHLRSREGGHWLHLDNPDLVIDAIRNCVSTVRDLSGG